MTQRKGLQGKYPATFTEWVCGITIEDALGPRVPAQPQQRKVVKVEVTTDDETEEDSLKVTYPRTGRASRPQQPDVVVKKVRFEDVPKKSALKKSTSSATESDSNVSSKDATTEGETSDAASEQTSESKKNGKATSASSSEADSSSEASSGCAKCALRRKRASNGAKDGEKQCASDSEGSQSSTNSGLKGKKHSKQAKTTKNGEAATNDKSDASEADDEASDSSKATEKAGVSAKKGNDKNKQPKDKKGSDNKNQKSPKKQDSGRANKQAASDAGQKETAKESEKASGNKKKAGKQRIDDKKGDYPEAYLRPHPRRPHLIEPIRAEVVQTEKVVEGPEDPPPNAYYDAAHGVLRVYHGPVYGNHFSQPLYPRRDASGRPLPIGMPHPTQNPYYYGFNQAQPQQGDGNEPITQGMPVPAWGAMCPPPGYMGYSGVSPYGPWQYDANVHANANATNNAPVEVNSGGTKGVFSLVAENNGSSSSAFKDKDGQNNVAPGSIKDLRGRDNPYIPKLARSPFSTYGSRVPSNASHASGAPGPNNVTNPTVSGNEGTGDAGTGQPSEGAWGNNAQSNGSWNGQSQQQDQWGSNDNQDKGWDTQRANDANDSGKDGGWGACNGGNGEANGGGTWGDTGNSSSNAQGGWDNGDTNADNNAGGWDTNGQATEAATAQPSQWGDSGGTDNSASSVVHTNNVMPGSMPGSWDAPVNTPAWGDPSMAASTNGQVDAPGW